MTTAWSHLPNAAHIDRILADLKPNLANLSAAWDVINKTTWDARHEAARNAVEFKFIVREALNAASAVYTSTVYSVACSAILALIVWPESADYLSLPINQVRVLTALGDQRAILILPAIIAFEKSEELL